MNKHIFACYTEHLSELVTSLHKTDLLRLKDALLWNRLVKILRIKPKEPFILFDEQVHVELVAHDDMQANKRTVVGILEKKAHNIPLAPPITLLLPILKKEALEYATYVASQMGVQEIIPIVTEKSDSKISDKERDRLKKIMIAACEQSKNFIPPQFQQPQLFIQAIHQNKSLKLCFDEREKPMSELVNELKKTAKNSILITLGPEGGLVEHEKKALQTAGFTCYALTPTVLRSREAITIGLGVVRGIISPQRFVP